MFLVAQEVCLLHKSQAHCHAYMAQGSLFSNVMIATSTFDLIIRQACLTLLPVHDCALLSEDWF